MRVGRLKGAPVKFEGVPKLYQDVLTISSLIARVGSLQTANKEETSSSLDAPQLYERLTAVDCLLI